MIPYLGSLVQFSRAAGRAGRCRQISLCVGNTRHVLARQPEVLAASPQVRRAFTPAASSPGGQRFGRPLPGCCAPFPSAASGSGSQMLGALSPGAPSLFPQRPQRAPPVGSQEVFRQEPGPVCRVGGGGLSGAEFAPFPSPCLLPPAGMGRLFSGVSQSLCFANRWRCVPASQFFPRSPTV